MTDDVLVATRLRCSGPGCGAFYDAPHGLPAGWRQIFSEVPGGYCVSFCGLSCLRAWAEEQP